MSPRKRITKPAVQQGEPFDEIVIERPEYNETVICSVTPGAWPIFEAAARAWWTAPTQLSLLASETIEQRHVREIASFHDAMRVSAFGNDAYPPHIEVAISKTKGRKADAPRSLRRVSPPAVRGNRITIATTLGRRAIAFALAGATELGERWNRRSS